MLPKILCFKKIYLTPQSRDTLVITKKGTRPSKILQTMQNHNPLRKQTLGKILDGQAVCPVYQSKL